MIPYKKPTGFIRSMGQAIRGIIYTWRTQRHLQIHLTAAIIVVICGWLTKVSRFEWLALIFAIGSVIAAEVINTAIEIVVDLVEPNFHPMAGMAKDIAAGTVLVAVIQAVIIGLVVFGPHLLNLLRRYLISIIP